ncbi:MULTISPECIES: lantibiotic dehydratase [Chryseobacterium]|uniref:lantibiotic dehydratase n=1 Tax=Chryseobacterium TaxID=59732 RepID=UPI001D1395F2|nr:lantibiotic dehydratase [Chryseobacterium sp. X308]MCC3213874.1 lantibiotic dehydratase [Chryseobacterium sp. X308]
MYESTFYAARQPLLPINNFFDFYSIINQGNEQFILDYLVKQFTENYQLEEGLYLASDILYNEVIKYKTVPSRLSDKERKRMVHSLTKYYIRASTRATPFGLFANFREGNFNSGECKNDSATEVLDYYPKLDMEVLFQIGEYISKIKGVKKYFILSNNTSLYKTKDDYRYIEYRFRKGMRTHHLVSIESDDLINFIIKISRKGIKYETLINKILDQYDVEQEDIEVYIDRLIDCKLLTTNLDVNITGRDYFDVLLAFLRDINSDTDDEILLLKNILQEIKSLLRKVNARQSNIEFYKKIYILLKEFLPNLPEKNLIQLDVVSPIKDYTLSSDLRHDLGNLLSVFSAFSKSYPPKHFQLEIFKRAFSERYEDRKVKLTEVLDEEIGIGYKSAVSTKDIYESKTTGKTKFTAFALKKYHEYLKNNSEQIEITDRDIKENFSDVINIETAEPGFTYLLNVYPGKEQPLFHVTSYSPAMTGLSGRFCGMHQGFYEKLHDLVDIIEARNNNYIYAEIVHLPQARVGNVIARPYFGKYEIPFLANSLLSENQKVYVNDLYIQMINNELYLFSEKLNKPIKPRLSNAHSYRRNGLPIYHFLCDMQFQNFDSQLIWDWGIVQDIQEYLPRVVYKGIIIQQAYWIIKGNNFSKLRKSKDFDQFKKNFAEIKSKLNVTDMVVFKESDNILYFDFSTDLGIELFQKYINQNDKQIILHECLLEITDDNSLPKYSKELVVPFIKKESKKNYPLKIRASSKDAITRTFIPGSEWVYFKVYIGDKFSNKFLVAIADYIEKKLVKKGLVEKWFFIRYADPKRHLRIRLNVKDPANISVVTTGISQIFNTYIKSGKVSGVVQDTYTRELERYKGKNIINSETFFYHDSKFVYNLYKSFSPINYNYLFLISYFTIEEYLDTLGMNHDKLRFLERNFNYFAKEFNYESDKLLRNSLHDELRRIKDITISKGLNPAIIEVINNSEVKNILLSIKNEIKDEYFNVLGSYIHMTVNRLFSEKQRFNEFRVYFFLYKKYQSIVAREVKSVSLYNN